MTNTFGITARAYRWYADGTETGAAALAAENAQLDINNLADFPIVLRYGVQESGAGSASGATTDDYQLQYSLNAGAFVNVTGASTVVQGFTSGSLTDAAATTQRLSAGTGAFVAGEISETDGLLTDWQLTANNFSELLYAITILAADTADGDAITFRVLRNGAVFNTYSVTPQLTVQNAYTLTADAGSVAITGTAATLMFARRLTADAGAFAITGTAAGLSHGFRITADAGSFVITGTAASLEFNRILVAAAGSVAIAGTDASLEFNRIFHVDTGAFAIAGTNASLELGREIAADPGSFAITGTAAQLLIGRRLTAESGTYAIAGTAASLLFGRRLDAAAGSVVITGTDAILTLAGGDPVLIAGPGAFVITGTAAGLLAFRRIVANAGVFAIAGIGAGLDRGSTSLRHTWHIADTGGRARDDFYARGRRIWVDRKPPKA